MAACGETPLRNSSRYVRRSQFASTAMPTVRMMPAMPGSDSAGADPSTATPSAHDVGDQHSPRRRRTTGSSDHEHEQRAMPNHQRGHTLADVFLAELRADGLFVGDRDAGRERSAAQQQRGLARLVIDRPVVRIRLLKMPWMVRR